MILHIEPSWHLSGNWSLNSPHWFCWIPPQITPHKCVLLPSRKTTNILSRLANRIKFTYNQYVLMMMKCACVMVDRRRMCSLIFSRDHCQRSSQSWTSDTPWAGFEPLQNLSLCLVEWSCAVLKTTTPHHRNTTSSPKFFVTEISILGLWQMLISKWYEDSGTQHGHHYKNIQLLLKLKSAHYIWCIHLLIKTSATLKPLFPWNCFLLQNSCINSI